MYNIYIYIYIYILVLFIPVRNTQHFRLLNQIVSDVTGLSGLVNGGSNYDSLNGSPARPAS